MGKSLNLSMLRTFLDCDGIKYRVQDLFKDLLIRNELVFETHFANQPVLYVNMPKKALKECKEEYSLVEVLGKHLDSINPEESIEDAVKRKFNETRRKVWVLYDEPELLLMRGLRHGFLDSRDL
jgi:hypothetical protein